MKAVHPWVILFDIDGTLLTVDRNFNRPLLKSIIEELNIEYDEVMTVPFAGRTDHDILSSFLENHDFDQALYMKLKNEYLKRLEEEIADEHVIRHPHIDDAIQFFTNKGCVLGLLTGNFPDAAELKLRIANIDLDYKIGAFGEYHSDRNMLPQIALNKAEMLFDAQANPKRFIIIGDTPRDVACAKSAGMRCVAVTTGKFTKEELAEHGPDLIIETMKNPEGWFKELVGDEA